MTDRRTEPVAAGDQANPLVACDSCGQPTPKRWQLGLHHCERCHDIQAIIDRVVTWNWTPDAHRSAADPIAALTDLHTARAHTNQLIRRLARQAHTDGATWEQIGQALHLDPRDTRARYSQP